MPSATTESPEHLPIASDNEQKVASVASEKRPAKRWRPGKKLVLQRLRTLLKRAATAESRRVLSRLVRRLQSEQAAAKRLKRIDAAVQTAMDEAAADSRDGPLVLEAATWVIAWRRGSKYPPGAEHLEAEMLLLASEARHRLSSADTSAAAFVLTASRLLEGTAAQKSAVCEATIWAACEEEIERLVTSTGCVSLDGSDAVVSRVARWTWIHDAAEATGTATRRAKRAFARKAEQRWKQAVSGTLRLLGPGGRPVVHEDGSVLPSACGEELAQAAVRRGTKAARAAADLLLQPLSRRTKNKARALSLNLDDRKSAVVVLRSGWQGRSIRVLMNYRSEQPYLEIVAGERMLMKGPWQWAVQLSGEPVSAEGPWQVTHHEEDEDVTLMVFAAMLSGGLRLERHLLLARENRAMLLADAVVDASSDGSTTGLVYRGSLPIARGIEVNTAAETRELILNTAKPEGMLMPLALPEWRCGHTPHSWSWDSRSHTVQLQQHSAVRRLFAPVWIDLAPRRFTTQVTWRQLTVADTRVILRPEQAAGFRIQAGQTQWLLYRALDEPRNRTFLGCNVSSFFRLGTLGEDGLVSQMAEW